MTAGAISKRTSGSRSAAARPPGPPGRRDAVGRAGEHQHRHGMSASRIVRSSRSNSPAARRCLREPVVQLAERPARVGDHVVREPVDRLDLGEELGVVEVLGTASGLVTSLSTEESWNAQLTSGFGAPPSTGRAWSAGPGGDRLSNGRSGATSGTA